MKIKTVPEGYHSLTPDLVVKDVAQAIEFYKKAFGAKKRRVFHGSDGSIVHTDIQIGDSILMLLPVQAEKPKLQEMLKFKVQI